MQSNSIRLARLWDAFKRWLPGFVLAFLLVFAFHALFLSERATCSALVHFNYTGVESGFDPSGHMFDPTEIKNAEVVRRAAEAAGLDATAEAVERIRAALDVQADVSGEVFDTVTENTSIFGENKLSEVTDIRESAYFPANYTVKLRYANAGLPAQDAQRFLSEFLTAYETFFYDKYGYHVAFENSLNDNDYQTYDYIDAVDVLGNHLTTLRAYLTHVEGQDTTRFVSAETGYSFPDLIDTLDTIRSENVQWVTSYIVSNNMTKDRQYLIDYYQYKIEDAQRALTQLDSRLYTLNQQIESYVKTNAVFPIMGDSGGDSNEVSGEYEFTQPSQMYNDLINQKVACQTSISETREQIAMLTRRMERLQSGESSGSAEIVEQQLTTIDQKAAQLLSDIQRTSDDFYRSEWLENAFQILEAPRSRALSIGLKDTALDIIAVETLLFGLCMLSAVLGSRKEKEKVAQ